MDYYFGHLIHKVVMKLIADFPEWTELELSWIFSLSHNTALVPYYYYTAYECKGKILCWDLMAKLLMKSNYVHHLNEFYSICLQKEDEIKDIKERIATKETQVKNCEMLRCVLVSFLAFYVMFCVHKIFILKPTSRQE